MSLSSEMQSPVAVADPLPLPFCPYPQARDTVQHGLQTLPDELPLVDFPRVQPYRSRQHVPLPAARFTPAHVLEMARVVATSFARREPQTRHLQPPRHPPALLAAAQHRDPFGSAAFGPWTTEALMYWFIRLLVLTDPASPRPTIRVNDEALTQSLAVMDRNGRVIGGAFNETMPPVDTPLAFREGDPFLDAVLSFTAPILSMLSNQDTEALGALCARYPAFREAYAQGKVGHHFMVARSDALAKADAFELVAATAAHYQALGYEYMGVEASNQWTGAACELLNGVRVHFAPYQARPVVEQSAEALEDRVSSPNGFLSDKDSGCMFYVIRLR